MTFPEWYTVYSYQEYANFIEKNRPSQFPYFSAVKQFWSGYCDMYGITYESYSFRTKDQKSKRYGGNVLYNNNAALSGFYRCDEIMLTAIARSDWNHKISNSEQIFSMKILTQPYLKRLESNGVKIEHIYDY